MDGINMISKKTKKGNLQQEIKNKKSLTYKIISAFLVVLIVWVGIWYTASNEEKEMFSELGSEIKSSYVERGLVETIIIGISFLVLAGTIFYFAIKYKLKRLKEKAAGQTVYSFLPHLLIPIFFYFFIPMTFIIIVFMGSLQSYYQYETTFLNDSYEGIQLASESSRDAAMGLLEKIYTLGEESPVFYMWLCFGAMIFLLIQAVSRGKREYDEDLFKNEEFGAQNLLDKIDYKDLSKKDLEEIEMLKKGKMKKKIVEKIKEGQEKRIKNGIYYPEVIINIDQMKGGKI